MWASQGPVWARLGPVWGECGPVWGKSGPVRGQSGASVSQSGASLGQPRAPFRGQYVPEFLPSSLEGKNKRRSGENDQENACARVRNDLWHASWTRGRRGSGGPPSGAFRALGCQTQDFTLDRDLSTERQAETRKRNYTSTSYLGRVVRQPASQPAVFRVAGVENLILELGCLVESCRCILSLRFEVQRSPETLTASRASST